MHLPTASRCILAAAAALGFSSAALAQQTTPPPNDDFAHRMILTGQAVSSTPVAIDHATREGLERADTGQQTVWYTWTAPADGVATVSDQGTTFTAQLSIFNGGTLSRLARIDTSDSGSPVTITFSVRAGFVYQFCLGSVYSGSTGTAVLNIDNRAPKITAPVVVAAPAGANDNFAEAVALAGATVSAFTYPNDATREGQEPASTGNATVWWTWTAPATATVTMNTAGTDYTNVLTVFNGDSLADIAIVGQDRVSAVPTVSFPAQAGTRYVICVGDQYGSPPENTSVLNISTVAPTITTPVVIQSLAAANDNFANAQDLGNTAAVTGYGFNGSATTETLEPAADAASTLWWTWTAPQDGSLAVTADGTTFYHNLIPYTGDSLGTLQAVPVLGPDTESHGGFSGNPGNPAVGSMLVTGGTTYHFVMGTTYAGNGTAVLNLDFTPLSHVSVTADEHAVAQSASSTASFTITRDGDLSPALVVHFKLKGTAGLDTEGYRVKKKIKPGQSSTTVTVSTKGSGFSRAKIKLVITPNDAYLPGSPTRAKITVLDE